MNDTNRNRLAEAWIDVHLALEAVETHTKALARIAGELGINSAVLEAVGIQKTVSHRSDFAKREAEAYKPAG